MYDIINFDGIKTTDKESMFIKFNELCINQDLYAEWEDYLENLLTDNFSA